MKIPVRAVLSISGILMIIGVIGGCVYLALCFSDYSVNSVALALYIIQLAIQLSVGLYGVYSKHSKRKSIVCSLFGLLLIGLGVYSSFFAIGTLITGAFITLFIVPIIYTLAALTELLSGCKADGKD